jgi:hypothetical protein
MPLAANEVGRDMNRTEFEALRDLNGKTIHEDIRFAKSRAMSPLLVAEGIRIANEHGVDVRLTISYNPQVGAKTFNVHIPGHWSGVPPRR